MSVKQYIHPRNKYKRPPDYKQLAILYPEFREIAMMDFTGRIRIDFKERRSLHVLTETLLKHDFDLHVNIPADNLNPAIPLRLNYILWIEDLMTHSKLEMENVTGIDIGTGAVCIYALLLAKIYKCQVIGTEVDKGSVEHAQKCIKSNKLQNLIEITTVNSDRIFKDVVQDSRVYDFSMCNPPFFENEDDGFEKVVKVLPPRNAPTGNDNELKTEGGELGFVTKIIEESVEVGNRVKIYSTMIGKKVNLVILRRLLRSKNIKNMTWTEFCQGHTTRWGLAWSFLPQNVVNLTTAPVIRKRGKSIVGSLKNYKTSITFPVNDKFSCVDDIINFLRVTAKELNVKLQDVPIPEDSFDSWACQVTARKRSWEHMRRKRRLAQRSALKRAKSENGECIEANTYAEETSIETGDSANNSDEVSSDKELPDKDGPLLVCKLWVEAENCDDSQDIITQSDEILRIWMLFENGYGGLDALHSLRQYLINKLDVREKILDNPSKTKRKKKRVKKGY
ncbi:PREDICTED: methyltransferase-like protein 16 homolog [Cyphomyrmex costatus]|uniref:U6 small nuclear RNA (adenine-(43)-N(6))-methyltransferase n=1 Tax=Cyphomyrmex costatus TaxID=456900 RepID=A0A195C479_9HYME|nr:PREDICTED: methyltransferase-like protein 16 homolog [Cyphomyrmex costatus]KYM95659.1 Putative methyltransferase METT10D [Cyphomyrmex costatus]